jgi:hypothetical protein
VDDDGTLVDLKNGCHAFDNSALTSALGCNQGMYSDILMPAALGMYVWHRLKKTLTYHRKLLLLAAEIRN